MGNKTQKLSNVVDQIVEWQAVVTADGSTGLTAVAGRGYFIDTTSGAITVTLPASPKIGDTITITDYASTFNTNNVTINPNGNKLEADTSNGTLSTNDQTHTFVFTDATQGWKIVNQDTGTTIQPTFISATGGTVTTSGDFKIHTFTGDGCFVVASLANPIGGPNTVDYLVVAGGAGSGNFYGGGGGAGGFREGKSSPVPSYTASPLVAPAGLPVSATTYPITVGAGGAGTPGPTCSSNVGGSGVNSVFSTITSAGGGGGSGGYPSSQNGAAGGSGGGAGGYTPHSGGAGNTPPTSPSQGNNGGGNTSTSEQAGGGGATAAATNTSWPNPNPALRGSAGGAGAGTAINPSPSYGTPGPSPSLRYFAGGGGGVNNGGGVGGGGNGSCNPVAPVGTAGTTNTGGGGGTESKNGGSGIVVIRYKFQ